MNKCISFVLAVLVVLSMVSVCASASENETGTVIMLEDGSYFIVTLQAIETRTNATISGNKSYSYYTNNGELKWTAVLHGTFTYTCISAVCTASSCDVTIYDAGWYVASKNVGKNANAATVDLAVSKKVLGITVDTVSVSLTLRCDKYGKLS